MKKLSLYTIFNLLTYLIFCILTTFSHAQDNEGVSEENAEIKQHFPITVIDMQYIVARSSAAVLVREELEDLKKKYSLEISNEEEELKALQEELSSQRSILPPDEFSKMESEFREKVERLQTSVAEKNKEIEVILNRSVNAIQTKAIQIVTNIARERSLAAVLDTSTVVIAADSINISNQVLEILNKELPSLDIENVNEDEVEEFYDEGYD